MKKIRRLKKSLYELDASGLYCPYPLAHTKACLKSLKAGEYLKVISTDPASEIDFKVFAELSQNKIIQFLRKNHTYIFFFQKK